MAPKSRCEGTLVVVVYHEASFGEGLSKSSRLGQSENSVANIKLNQTVGIDKFLQVVFVDEVPGYVGGFNADILWAVSGVWR